MAIRLIDTKTVHTVEVSGTRFQVRAFNWGQALNWMTFLMKGSHASSKPSWLSDRERREMLDMMAELVVEIEGHSDKVDTLERMDLNDLIMLGVEIQKLSTLEDDAEKK